MADFNIENGIIGCLFLDPQSIYKIYDTVKTEMFESSLCQRTYEKIIECFEKGQEIDAIIIANKLADKEVSAKIYEKEFSDIILNTPTSIMLERYSETLIENYKNRIANNILRTALKSDYLTEGEIENVICQLEELKQGKKQTAKNISEIMDSFKDIYFTDNNKERSTLTIGLDKIDDFLLLIGGDVTVIGARPSVGKSAFALQIAVANAIKGKKVGYFNLEMLDKQVLDRVLANVSGLSLARIQKGISFLGEEKEQYEKGKKAIDKMKIIISTGSKTDLDIKAECRHQDFDLIIIDYLQLVRCSRRCESRRVEVGEVSRSLKSLSMELNVPIIVLSQLSRNSEYKVDKEPTMADLRETGDIEQDASNILLLWNLNDNDKKYKGLKIDKNRQGELTSECLEFIGDNMKFIESKESIEDIKQLSGETDNYDDCPFI